MDPSQQAFMSVVGPVPACAIAVLAVAALVGFGLESITAEMQAHRQLYEEDNVEDPTVLAFIRFGVDAHP